MNREEVNIYIETTIKGPSKRAGAYFYIIERFNNFGEPETKGGFCYDVATENQFVLAALIRAIKRIEEPASVRVFTSCGYVLHSLQNNRPVKWKKDGWINAKGDPVKNADLWNELLEVIDPHIYTVTDKEHCYEKWMHCEMERRVKEKKDAL